MRRDFSRVCAALSVLTMNSGMLLLQVTMMALFTSVSRLVDYPIRLVSKAGASFRDLEWQELGVRQLPRYGVTDA
jgi:hypothetical protein